MIPISDSIYASVPLPLDTKLTNIRPSGPNTIIEGITEYLTRVTLDSRYLGMIVPIVYPEGTYENSDFKQKIESRQISVTLYSFTTGIQDEDFLPWCPTCDPPIIQSRWVSVSSTCAIDSQGRRTGIVDTLEKEEKKVDDGPWTPTGQTRITTNYNPTICPLPLTREVEVSRACVVTDDGNNGYLKIIYNIEQQTEEGDWIVVEENKEKTIYDAVACPVPVTNFQYRWVDTSFECVKVDGYNNTVLRTYRKEQKSTNGEDWVDTGNSDYVDTSDATICPLPQFRWVNVSSTCEKTTGFNTGNLLITQKEQVSENNGNTWTDTGDTRIISEYNTGSCPVTPYGLWTSLDVELNGIYNTAIEKSIPYSTGSPITFTSVTTALPEYHYLMLSVPIDKTFTLYDVLGNTLTTEYVTTDNRTGYRNNKIIRYDQPFGTDEVLTFRILIT